MKNLLKQSFPDNKYSNHLKISLNILFYLQDLHNILLTTTIFSPVQSINRLVYHP